jgi:hypothetical protein
MALMASLVLVTHLIVGVTLGATELAEAARRRASFA